MHADITRESEREHPSALQRDFYKRAQASRDLVDAFAMLNQRQPGPRQIIRVGEVERIDMRPAIVCGAVLVGFLVGLLLGSVIWG